VAVFLWSLSFNAIHAVWPNYLVGHLGYTRTEMSRLWSLAALTEVPMMVMAGWLSDRIGRLPVLSLSLICWTFVFLGWATVPVYPWILLIQFGRGFGMSTFLATAMTYVTEVTSQSRRGRASGLYSAIGSLGSMLGGTLGGALTQQLGFQTLLFTCTGLVSAGAIYLTGVYARWRTATAASREYGG
jgi:MFS family permease